MKKFIAAALSILVAACGYTMVDKATDERLATLESQASSYQLDISDLKERVSKLEATTTQEETVDITHETTKPSTSKFDAQKFVQDLNASIKRFSESVKFVYDKDSDSWTVVGPDGKDTGLFGFKYSMTDQVFYTAEDAWQRNFDFEETYDNVSGAGTISYDTIRFKFNYNNKEWMMQYWKGQYGSVLIGAELGLYNRDPDSTSSTYYNCVTDDEKLNMSVKVYRQDPNDQNKYNLLFKRSPSTTWWLTGFTPGTLSAGSYVVSPDETANLRVEYTINFDTAEQAKAFVGGLQNTTTIEHNAPKKSRSIKFTEFSVADYDKSTKSEKFAVAENGKTVYMSWR